jgi:hypothetical protein
LSYQYVPLPVNGSGLFTVAFFRANDSPLGIHQIEKAAHLHAKKHTNGNYPINMRVQVLYRVRVYLNSMILDKGKRLIIRMLQNTHALRDLLLMLLKKVALPLV